MSDPTTTSFTDFVREQERDPSLKEALDDARAVYRDDDPPAAGVREPSPTSPPSAPSEAGAQEADCPSSEKPAVYDLRSMAAQVEIVRADRDVLAERVRVLEEALEAMLGHAPLTATWAPQMSPADVAYQEVRQRARKALPGGGEQHDE